MVAPIILFIFIDDAMPWSVISSSRQLISSSASTTIYFTRNVTQVHECRCFVFRLQV